jgi:hypothetical protein
MLAASAKPTSAMTTPATSSDGVSDQGRASDGTGRPLGTSPTSATSTSPYVVRSSAKPAPTKAPGKRGLIRRPRRTSAIIATPIAIAVGFQVLGSRTASSAARTGLVSSEGTSSSAGSCEQTISSAAAAVKADTTGWLIRYATKPHRNRPISSRTTPTTSASRAASATYWSVPTVASEVSAPSVSRLVSATGPVCR